MSKKYDENQILEFIQNKAEDVEIPDSVKPENMMNYIAKKKEEGYFEGVHKQQENIKRNKRRRNVQRWTIGIGAVAAILIVAIVGVSIAHRNGGHNSIYELYGNIRTQNDDGVYVLSSYKDLATYTVAEQSKYKKQTLMDIFEDFTVSVDDMLNMGGSKGEAVLPDGDMNFGDAIQEGTPSETPNDDYSDTNSRTEGVGEADIVKTDGEYIYYIDSYDNTNTITIVKAKGANTEKMSTFVINNDIKYIPEYGLEYMEARDLLIYEDKLVVIVNYADRARKNYTGILVYDVNNASAPKNISFLYGEGEYTSCKYVDGQIYIMTQMYRNSKLDQKSYDEDEAKEIFAPIVNGQYMDCSQIYLAQAEKYEYYNIILSVDMTNPSEFKDSKAVLGESGNTNVYMSTNNIYIISNIHNDYISYIKSENSGQVSSVNKAEIVRISYKDGMFETTGRVEIAGELGDEFDIDEYNGYLRMAVSKSENKVNYGNETYIYFDGEKWVESKELVTRSTYINHRSSVMYVLDDKLELVGEITLKEEEEVYGVRFDGDIAYVVTYREMDPLFTVDLSDPTAPKIMGALKIHGFSEYLHIWDKNTLLGIGYGESRSVKISTYDITDKYDVTESYVKNIEGAYYSPALYDHRAVFISPDKNLLGFAVEGYLTKFDDNDFDIGDFDVSDYGSQYRIYEYEDGEFKLAIVCPFKDEDEYRNARALYIGEYIYLVVPGNAVHVFNMSDYSNVAIVK